MMVDDSLVELQHQMVLAARGVAVAAIGWLLLLGVVALRHRRSPARAHAALRRLGAPALLCRLVLVLVCAGLAAPAHAAAGDGSNAAGQDSALQLAEALDGLPSPALPAPGPPVFVRPAAPADATAASRPSKARPEARDAARAAPAGRSPCADHRVRPGESLWTITSDHLDTTDVPAVDRGWRTLYAANRSAIGDDPDVIRPGVRLDVSRLQTDC